MSVIDTRSLDWQLIATKLDTDKDGVLQLEDIRELLVENPSISPEQAYYEMTKPDYLSEEDYVRAMKKINADNIPLNTTNEDIMRSDFKEIQLHQGVSGLGFISISMVDNTLVGIDTRLELLRVMELYVSRQPSMSMNVDVFVTMYMDKHAKRDTSPESIKEIVLQLTERSEMFTMEMVLEKMRYFTRLNSKLSTYRELYPQIIASSNAKYDPLTINFFQRRAVYYIPGEDIKRMYLDFIVQDIHTPRPTSGGTHHTTTGKNVAVSTSENTSEMKWILFSLLLVYVVLQIVFMLFLIGMQRKSSMTTGFTPSYHSFAVLVHLVFALLLGLLVFIPYKEWKNELRIVMIIAFSLQLLSALTLFFMVGRASESLRRFFLPVSIVIVLLHILYLSGVVISIPFIL